MADIYFIAGILCAMAGAVLAFAGADGPTNPVSGLVMAAIAFVFLKAHELKR